MPYRILDPGQFDPSFTGKCALAIMAKAPREGKVKTRLAPPLSLRQSADLNICFLRDTSANLAGTSSATGLVCYTPIGEEAAFDGLLPGSFALIPQRGDAFGERLFAAAQDILACGFSSVCLIDSDSPTVPSAAFAQAVQELAREGDRVILGPSHDGGYYLIGLKAPHPEPFSNITWSTETVAEETRERCRAAALDVVELPLWYDVDDGATLAILEDELLHQRRPSFATLPGFAAPASRAFLSNLQSAGTRQPGREEAGR